jgi:hypothetical protein
VGAIAGLDVVEESIHVAVAFLTSALGRSKFSAPRFGRFIPLGCSFASSFGAIAGLNGVEECIHVALAF